jgi:hypothetical protein
MNTFLPYPDFQKSAQCLDYKRLGKQRVEAWQIYLSLHLEDYGWQNHPIVKMWRDFELALLDYGMTMCEEWIKRGYKDTMLQKFYKEFLEWNGENLRIFYPSWLGNRKFHSAMRSNLLRKDKKYYSKFGWKEKDNLPYYWIKE